MTNWQRLFANNWVALSDNSSVYSATEATTVNFCPYVKYGTVWLCLQWTLDLVPDSLDCL